MTQRCILLFKPPTLRVIFVTAMCLCIQSQITLAESDWQTTVQASDLEATYVGMSGDKLRSNLGGPPTLAAITVDKRPRLHPLIGLTWYAKASCVPEQLKKVLNELVAVFGPIAVTSTCRGVAKNRLVGGAEHSYHLHGQAIDFLTAGAPGAVAAFLATSPQIGGLKYYGHGLFHIDIGPRRTW